MLRLGIVAPGPTTLQVFHARLGEPFTERKSASRRLLVGENDVSIRFGPARVARIRIDPGDLPGRYEIRDLRLYAWAPDRHLD